MFAKQSAKLSELLPFMTLWLRASTFLSLFGHCRCGYVLQPECIRNDLFDLYNRDAAGVEPLTLTLTVSQ